MTPEWKTDEHGETAGWQRHSPESNDELQIVPPRNGLTTWGWFATVSRGYRRPPPYVTVTAQGSGETSEAAAKKAATDALFALHLAIDIIAPPAKVLEIEAEEAAVRS